jgi:K+-sensing histidine kinase KdpD
VHKIIAEHNGTIKIEDHKPQGTSFIIELPVPSQSYLLSADIQLSQQEQEPGKKRQAA